MTDPDPTGQSILFQILFLIFLTAINAFFACAEMAIVSVSKSKINMLAEEGNKKALLVQKLLKEPTKFLSTIQVAITLAGFFASAVAATGISERLSSSLSKYNIPYEHQISIMVITIILSYFTLVFGELIPKRIALQKAEKISLFTVQPIIIASKIASPFVKLLSSSTRLVLRMLGMHHEALEEKVSEEEIRSMIETGQEAGVFNEYEKNLIESIFEFDDILAKEIMTSRTNVYAIDINDPLNEYIDELLATRHSRIPVYDDEIDNIIGILYMKDYFLEARKVGFENVNIKPILHKPYFVPESKNIDELFKELQQSRQYLAVLIDEYGGFSGIVTIEDLVEEVMGPINDMGDLKESSIEKIDNQTYLLNGLIYIDDLNDELGLNIISENHDTLSGFLLDMIGVIPEEDDRRIIKFNNLEFEIMEIKEKRIVTTRLKILNKEGSNE
jgi:putative hemolysin